MPVRKVTHAVTVTHETEQGTTYDTHRVFIQCSACGELRDGGDPTDEEIERDILVHRLEVLEKRAGIEFFRMADEERVDPE